MWWLAGYRASHNSVILVRRTQKWLVSVAGNISAWVKNNHRGLFKIISFHASGKNAWKAAVRKWCWWGRGQGDGLSRLSLESCRKKWSREAGKRKGETSPLPRMKDWTVITAADLNFFEGYFVFTLPLTQVCKTVLRIPPHPSHL